MSKRLLVISAIFLCLLGLMVVPLLNPEQPGTAGPGKGFTLGASSAYAQASRILIEGADSIFSQELQKSEQLSHQATNVSPRILVEYADSILSFNLERPLEIVPAPVPPPVTTPTPSGTPTPTTEQPVPEPESPPEPTLEPTPEPSSPTPWWLDPQWLISVIIGGLACIAGVIRLVIVLRRRGGLRG